jgi:hypothetical protein
MAKAGSCGDPERQPLPCRRRRARASLRVLSGFGSGFRWLDGPVFGSRACARTLQIDGGGHGASRRSSPGFPAMHLRRRGPLVPSAATASPRPEVLRCLAMASDLDRAERACGRAPGAAGLTRAMTLEAHNLHPPARERELIRRG